MWKSTVDGQALTFRLMGVNNQNFIMQDEQTGSWWQQVTGEAILGPLKGKRLEPQPFEQLTWATWLAENPDTQVLEAREKFAEMYWKETDEEEARGEEIVPFPVAADSADAVDRGALLSAVRFDSGPEWAYPMDAIREQAPINDRFDGRSLLVLLAADDRSVRAFNRELNGETMEFYALADADPVVWVDDATGSHWDFTGTAIDGPLKGSKLERFQVYADYWFDWKAHNPEGRLYTAGG